MDRLEEYAKKNNVPIMQKDGILFLTEYIRKNEIKTILEIGSAIGYSSITMAKVDKNIRIVTIERNIDMYNKAVENIRDFDLEKQIEVVWADALEYETSRKFDLIFIDGAKAQYINFFEKYQKNLNDGGTIISDNLDFHGLTKSVSSIKSKNLRSLVKKINNYREYLTANKDFTTKFLKIGDGIAVTKKS